MESLASNLLAYGPPATISAGLIFLIIHIMRQGSSDRTDYQKMLRELREQQSNEITTIKAACQRDIDNLRTRVGELEEKNRKLQSDMDDLRNKLWKAEDTAAKYRRRAEGNSS